MTVCIEPGRVSPGMTSHSHYLVLHCTACGFRQEIGEDATVARIIAAEAVHHTREAQR